MKKAVSSAKRALPDNSDIYVVDNSPSAESRQFAWENPDVIWEFSEENIGYLPARNRLMQMTNYKYYVSLDDDAWFVKGDELAAAINLLEEDEDTAVVAFDILTPDQPEEDPRDREPYQVNSFIGCGHVIRLTEFQAVGGYVKAVGYYGSEEKDLSIRLLDGGKKVLLMPGFHVWHDKSELGRDIFKQHRSEVCNDLSFAVTRSPLVLVVPIFFRKLALHVLFSARTGRWRSLGSGLDIVPPELQKHL